MMGQERHPSITDQITPYFVRVVDACEKPSAEP